MAQAQFNYTISGSLVGAQFPRMLHHTDTNGNVTWERDEIPTTTDGEINLQIRGSHEVDDRLLTFMEKAMEMDSRNLELLLPVVEKVILAYFKQ